MGKRFASGALVVSMIVAGIVTIAAGTASATTSSDQSRFVSLINYERTTDTKSWSCGRAGGLNSLSVASDLVSVAIKHSQKMAKQGYIEHDSSTWNSVSGWTEYGENVGVTQDTADPVMTLHTAFMNSAEHCQNILFSHTNPVFNQVGVGVVIDSNNTMYVTEIFVRRGSTGTSTTYHRSTTTRSTTTTTHHTTTYRPVASVTHAAAAKPKPKPLAPPAATPQTVDLLVRMIGMDSDNVDPATGAAAGF